jgi:AcrR family transcriptional regulator
MYRDPAQYFAPENSNTMKTEKKAAPSNERLAEIYRTAAQIILRKGYDATSINDIANAVGMTKAGLYHYINGKKELLFDIMNFGLDELDEEVATTRGIPSPIQLSVFVSSSVAMPSLLRADRARSQYSSTKSPRSRRRKTELLRVVNVNTSTVCVS